jgi:hypothetical protein
MRCGVLCALWFPVVVNDWPRVVSNVSRTTVLYGKPSWVYYLLPTTTPRGNFIRIPQRGGGIAGRIATSPPCPSNIAVAPRPRDAVYQLTAWQLLAGKRRWIFVRNVEREKDDGSAYSPRPPIHDLTARSGRTASTG